MKNYIQQLADYIQKNLSKGYTIDSLKYSLINQGYTKISIENAIDIANKQLAEEILPVKEKPQIIYKVITNNEDKILNSKKTFLQKFVEIIFN